MKIFMRTHLYGFFFYIFKGVLTYLNVFLSLKDIIFLKIIDNQEHKRKAGYVR